MKRKLLIKQNSGPKMSERALDEFRRAVEMEHLRRVDEIVVLQHVVRRFRLRHPADFSRLQEIRKAFADLLHSYWPNEQQPGFFPHTEMLCLLMSYLNCDKKLSFLEIRDFHSIKAKLQQDLEVLFLHHPLVMPPNDQDIAEFIELMTACCSDVIGIRRRLNYFSFYSCFAMSSLLSGEKFYAHYIQAKLGRHELMPGFDSIRPQDESLWMFTRESESDETFSALISTSCYRPIRTSKNVQIFGGAQHSISIDGTPLRDRLVLAVPTCEAPDKIDDMLREFREALMQEYIANTGGYYNLSTPEFDESVFMTQYSHEPCLIKDWNQVQRHVIGLWVWDEVCLENQSVEAASDVVAGKLDEAKRALRHGLPIYPAATAQRYYEYAAKEIGPRHVRIASKATKIDNFATRSNVILGAPTKLNASPP